MTPKRHSEAVKDRQGLRLSDSPRRSPLITHSLPVPARSIRPDDDESGLQSIHDQVDMGHRSSDFFEMPSDDELTTCTSLEDFAFELDVGRQQTKSNIKIAPAYRDRHVAGNVEQGHGGVDLEQSRTTPEGIAAGSQGHGMNTAHSSFSESVDDSAEARQAREIQLSKPTDETPRSSANVDEMEERSPASTKAEQILGAHLLAHEITLQALLRDEDAIDKSLHSFAAANGASFRASLLPPSLKIPISRNKGVRNVSDSQPSSKRVTVLPPPIDTSLPRPSLPDDFLPTPYPHEDDQVYRKVFEPTRSIPDEPLTPHQRHLLIRVLSNNSNILPKSVYITIPPSNHFSIPRRTRHIRSSPHLTPSFFDDEDLFQQLRQSFDHLSGGLRHFSARSLTRIRANGLDRPKFSADSRVSLSGILSPSISVRDRAVNENLLRHFRNPRVGRAKYELVRWAYRLAEQNSPKTSFFAEEDGTAEKGYDEGIASLDFVIDWSIMRVLFVLTLVILLSVLATLLWIFLGKNTPARVPAEGGFVDAGDRVAAGILVGVYLLAIGISMLAGWLGVSWLVM